jgi:hypothetical protein
MHGLIGGKYGKIERFQKMLDWKIRTVLKGMSSEMICKMKIEGCLFGDSLYVTFRWRLSYRTDVVVFGPVSSTISLSVAPLV